MPDNAGRVPAVLAGTAQAVLNRLSVRILLAMAAGAVAALGQAPWGLWPLSVIALAAVCGLVLTAPGARRAGLTGWAAGTGHYLLAFSWIVEPFLIDAPRYGWMAPFALFFLSAGMAAYWGLAAWLAARLSGTAVALVAALVLGEWVRGWMFTGFAWAQVGHVWIDTPLLHWAAAGGSLLLCVLALGLAASLWALVRGQVRALAVLLAVAGAWLGAPALQTAPLPRDVVPVVRIVQPNAPQDQKWDPRYAGMFFERQLRSTARAPRPALVVWPETAVPFYLDENPDALGAIALAAGGVPVVFGANRADAAGRVYNTLAVLEPDGTVGDIYDKHHLVPFGEFLPLAGLAGRLGLRGLAADSAGGYQPGPGPAVIDIPGVGPGVPLICYEGVFARDVRGMPRRGAFLLMITNDAWFGTVSGPYQHLAQARLRSVEMGLPMIRSANTGISAVIDANGRVLDSLPLGRDGWIDAPLPPAHAPTPYARTGDLPVLLLLLVALLAMVVRARRVSANRD